MPPSLRAILTEWAQDLGHPFPTDGCLEPWARQGVLLLNTVLTVRQGEPGSHAGRGWETLTRAIVASLAARPDPLVFFLWGAQAHRSRVLIDETRHIVLAASHPSPRSAWRACGGAPPFRGSAPFRTANAELARRGLAPIDWSLDKG